MFAESYPPVSVIDLIGKIWSFRRRFTKSGRLMLATFLILAGLGKLIKAVLDSSSPEASVWIVCVSVIEVWCAVGLTSRCTNMQSFSWILSLLLGVVFWAKAFLDQNWMSSNCGCFGLFDNVFLVHLPVLIIFSVCLLISWDFEYRRCLQNIGYLGFAIRLVTLTFLMSLVSILVGSSTGRSFAGLPVKQIVFGDCSDRECGIVDLGKMAPGEKVSCSVRLFNKGSNSVQILGGEPSCGCLSAIVFPEHVPANEGVDIRFNVSATGTSGSNDALLVVFLGLGTQQRVVIRIQYRLS